MTPSDDGPTEAPPPTPERLADRNGVDARRETIRLDEDADPGTLEGLDSHVAVGVPGDGTVLLVDDGHHGWTLPAVPLADGDDPFAVARRGVEGVTGEPVEVVGAERVRSIEYRLPGEDGAGRTVHNVVLRAAPLPDEPVAAEPSIEGDPLDDVGWFDGVPDDADDDSPTTTDVRLFTG